VEFKPLFREGIELYFSLMSSDGMSFMKEELKSDVLDQSLRSMIILSSIPSWARKLIGFHLYYFLRMKRLANIFVKTGMKTVPELWKLQRDKKRYQRYFYTEWKKQGIDIVICPVMTTVAVKHNLQNSLTPTVISYTGLYNLLDYPAGVLPITYVRKDDHKILRKISDPIDRFLNKNEVASEGIPVGIQVVGLPWRDEEVLKAMKIVHELIPFEMKTVHQC